MANEVLQFELLKKEAVTIIEERLENITAGHEAEAIAAKEAAEAAQLIAEQKAQVATEKAEISTTQAGISTDQAEISTAKAQEAYTSAQAADLSELAAKASELAAKGSENNSAASEFAAQQAKTAAETAKGLAEAARDAAALSKTDAETAKNNAEFAQAAAELAKAGAESARDTALNTVNDVRETGEKNSVAIATLENVINSANINQETTATVTGVDTVALPKTAANTGMQVQMFGQSAQNLVVNGDFRNGTTGWTATNSTISASNNILTNTGNGVSDKPDLIRRVDLTAYGNKIYINFQQRVTSANCVRLGLEILYYNNTSYVAASVIKITSTPTANLWYTISEIPTLRSNSDWNNFRIRIYHEYADSTTANGKISELRPVMAINLTALGLDSLTKEQCDLLFANYFEGIDNVLGTGRVRSVGKNILNLNPYGKKIYTGQTDGLTTAQRLLFYDVFTGITRGELLQSASIASFAINEYQVSFNSYYIGWGVGFKFRAKAGDVFSRRETVTGGSGGQSGFGFYDLSGNNLLETTNVPATAPANTAFGILVLAPNTANAIVTYSNVQLERGNVVTAFEPFRQSSLYLTTPELRSNGLIKDEIRKGTNGYELIQRINPADGTVLVTPLTIPIQHAGLLNSNSNGTAYFEPVIADAGVYSSNLAIQLTDYPIASFESIRKYANGTYTELNISTAVIASGGLSFTHPDLVSGDLVMFTYAYANESIGRSMTLTHYDSRFVEADTANGKVYRWGVTITNGVPTLTVTEV